MDYSLIVDRRQALWALQTSSKRLMREEFQKQGKEFPEDFTASAGAIQVIFNSIMNSPAYAIVGLKVMYLQSEIPEELLPYVVNHEELHFLVYDILVEDGLPKRMAGLGSKNLVDSRQCRVALAEVFNLPYARIEAYLKRWIMSTLPHVRLVRFIKRMIRGAVNAIR